MIIDIEGTDGCGKKTQTDLLYNYLISKGYKVIKISFPNYESESSALVKMYLRGDFGENVNDINGYQASVLYAVDRFATMSKINVNEYDYILFDRYVPSNMIHQSTRIKEQSELDNFLEWLEDFEYGKLTLPKPDKILFLDVPIEISLKLARQRENFKNGEEKDIHENDDNHLKNAYEKAKYVAKKFNWLVVDCSNGENIKSIDEIHKDILTKLNLK
ncbi:MAG: deoxynucleoside kinase [Clostridia bacterium]|nr:deoxynucleoside kinase [Clostridia bacterium]